MPKEVKIETYSEQRSIALLHGERWARSPRFKLALHRREKRFNRSPLAIATAGGNPAVSEREHNGRSPFSFRTWPRSLSAAPFAVGRRCGFFCCPSPR